MKFYNRIPVFPIFRPALLALPFLLGTLAAAAQSAPPPPDNRPYTYVEQMPVFPGGQAGLFQAIGERLQYPPEALQQRLGGRVFVSFVVDTTGRVSQVKVSKSVHPLLDAAAVRAISSLPAFTPGRQRQRPVPVAFTLPVTFQLPPAIGALPTDARPAGGLRPPRPVGGQARLEAYLRTFAAYPAAAQAGGLVVVRVKTDATGRLTQAKALAAPTEKAQKRAEQPGAYAPPPALLAAAETLLLGGPAWEPARDQNGPQPGTAFVLLQFDAPTRTVSLSPQLRIFPDELPTAHGGTEALLRHISTNINYPMLALQRSTPPGRHRTGTVTVLAEVTAQGQVERPLVLEPVAPDLDADVLRVVGALPRLFPALENGQAVRSFLVLPVLIR